jgi:cell division protein ZapA (FtsZ GTPase activity inhibitor)
MGYSRSDKKEDFITKIIEQSVLSENDWQFYISEVNKLFDNKIERLKKENPELTPTDLIVIAFICLKVNISDACVLLDMTTNTMYVRRKRIKKRIHLDSDTELEEWINKYLK